MDLFQSVYFCKKVENIDYFMKWWGLTVTRISISYDLIIVVRPLVNKSMLNMKKLNKILSFYFIWNILEVLQNIPVPIKRINFTNLKPFQKSWIQYTLIQAKYPVCSGKFHLYQNVYKTEKDKNVDNIWI